MKKPDNINFRHYNLTESEKGIYTVRFNGSLNADSSPGIILPLIRDVNALSFASLTADIDDVSYIDDFGILLIYELKKSVTVKKGAFGIKDKHGREKEILLLMDQPLRFSAEKTKSKRPRRLIEDFGETAIKSASNFKILVSFLGSAVLSFYRVLRNPKLLRTSDTILCMEKAGVNAVPIVALISFLLGLVIAFMSSLQLEQFGANLYVASLVSIAMVSELGPIMTAIVVAGRSGSAFAAEIGTMKISEEIDALFVMGFDPTLFLAVPRILASLVVVPLLTLFADIFAIAGGLVVGVLILDLTTSSYITQTFKVLTLFEFVWGMSKSAVFALIISWVGCLRGFQTRGGADAVGNAATSAVVSGIFLIILFDSMFAVGRSFLK